MWFIFFKVKYLQEKKKKEKEEKYTYFLWCWMIIRITQLTWFWYEGKRFAGEAKNLD